jgi:hypothetical protein
MNQLTEPLAVHWHGIELESYYDGVPGLSGSGQQLLKPIAPGGSFVVHLTAPRAGTFIYHTHIDDLKQLSSGLYGPLIVLPPGEKFDPESDRVLVISRAGPGETPIWLNGSRSPMMANMRAGQIYRLRIINIVPENPPIDISLKVAGIAVTWRPIAKDGADLRVGPRMGWEGSDRRFAQAARTDIPLPCKGTEHVTLWRRVLARPMDFLNKTEQVSCSGQHETAGTAPSYS